MKDQMTRVEAKVDTLSIVQGLHTEQISLAATKALESAVRIERVELNQGKTNKEIRQEREDHGTITTD